MFLSHWSDKAPFHGSGILEETPHVAAMPNWVVLESGS